MKHLLIFLLLATCSVSAFAQFPLGGKEKEIRAYFNKNIPYASAKDFKSKDNVSGLRFLKTKGLGDYTFYFDSNGSCVSYIVTYGNYEFNKILNRLNATFKPLDGSTWTSENEETNITVVPPKENENSFSVVYLQSAGNSQNSSLTLASN